MLLLRMPRLMYQISPSYHLYLLTTIVRGVAIDLGVKLQILYMIRESEKLSGHIDI